MIYTYNNHTGRYKTCVDSCVYRDIDVTLIEKEKFHHYAFQILTLNRKIVMKKRDAKINVFNNEKVVLCP